MTLPTGHILVKASKGKATHNGDGRYRKCWRLWSDGTVERTSSRSKYQKPFTDEMVPQTIREVAHQHGVTLKGFRERDPLKRRTP
tara:strand:- start:82 stop:336 length:255 start_codon:yes stop_codon:yes gene_type:complete